MHEALKHGGNLFAILGIALCTIAGLSRLFGSYYVVGFEAMTLFDTGTSLLIVACLAKLQLLLEKQQNNQS